VTSEPASAFVFYLQNHDQVANTLDGHRLSQCTSPARARALTALLLLAPETPLLFMGQEFAASTPFLFFADYRDLAGSIYEGRKKFLAQFPSYASAEAQAQVIDPCHDSTFERSKLDLSERHKHAEVYLMHRDLLRLRREDPVIALQDRTRIDGAVIGPQAFALRYFGNEGDDRLLIVNLGRDVDYRQAPEPLLASGHDRVWQLVWSSDAPIYGGPGIVNPCQEDGWYLPANSAVLLVAHYTRPS
jgi:maltooligosyltrehalose trehalohydrolase